MIPPKPFTEERLSGIAGLDQRSRDIFRRLVDTYLATGEPVRMSPSNRAAIAST